MGGSGSGLWRSMDAKTTVEECKILDCGKLQKDKLIREGVHHSGTLTWTNCRTGEITSSAGFTVNTLDPDTAWLELNYTITWKDDARCGEQEQIRERIGLTSTMLAWGKRRWWFRCQLIVNGKLCNRRVGKLYMPPDGKYYGCRHCYDLTYESSQEAHRFDHVIAMMALQMGITPKEVKRLAKKGLL